MGVKLYKGRVAKRGIICQIDEKDQSTMSFKNKGKLRCFSRNPDHSHPPGDTSNEVISYRRCLHEIHTDGIDHCEELQVDVT